MARVKNNPYNLSGKVGNQIFRVRDGVQYVSAAAGNHKVSNTKAAVTGREKFTFFTKLGKTIADNFILNRAWQMFDYHTGRTSNKIMKYYYHDVVNYDLANFMLVISDNQFPVTLLDVNISSTCLNVVTSPLPANENISVFITPLCSAQGFISLYNPAYKKKEKFFFIPLQSADIECTLTGELQIKIKIPYKQYKQFNMYPVKQLVLNLVLKNSTGNPVRFSKTAFQLF